MLRRRREKIIQKYLTRLNHLSTSQSKSNRTNEIWKFLRNKVNDLQFDTLLFRFLLSDAQLDFCETKAISATVAYLRSRLRRAMDISRANSPLISHNSTMTRCRQNVYDLLRSVDNNRIVFADSSNRYQLNRRYINGMVCTLVLLWPTMARQRNHRRMSQ